MTKDEQSHIEKRENANKIKVAIFCISAIVIFYIGANFLKGLDVFSKKTYYYAVFDNMNGLYVSAPLVVNGYKIGTITRLELMKQKPIKICVEILVSEKLDIPVDSKVSVLSQGLMSGNALNLIMGNSDTPAHAGDTLTAIAQSGSLNELLNKVSTVLVSVDTIALSLKEMLVAQGGISHFNQSLANLEQITADVNALIGANKNKIGGIADDLKIFTNSLKTAAPQLNHLVDNFDKIADSLGKANVAGVVQKLNKTVSSLESVLAKANNGTGSLGKLMTDSSLHTNLLTSTESLNALLIDVKANPKRYINISIFSKKEKKEKKEKKKK